MEMRRRGFLLGAVAGACAAMGGDAAAKASTCAAIPPPGSDGGSRLRTRCTACNLCVAKCPTKVLTAATLEYGLGGTMMPVMDFARGYCEKGCTRCGEVCPTGAIRRLSAKEKAKTKIGRAVLVSGWEDKCLAHKENHACALCQKHCLYEAVKVVEEKAKDGTAVRRPAIAAAACVGCGACAYVCPARVLDVKPLVAPLPLQQAKVQKG